MRCPLILTRAFFITLTLLLTGTVTRGTVDCTPTGTHLQDTTSGSCPDLESHAVTDIGKTGYWNISWPDGNFDGLTVTGNAAPQPPVSPVELKNGFRALREFDKAANGGNGDGIIDVRDSIFSSLRLWQDRNHNGISELSELCSLPQLGLAAIDLDYKLSERRDGNNNTFRYRAKVTDIHGNQMGRWVYDVFLDARRAQ